ncbi:MAG: DNA endonuclease SmrA [Cellvibrionaceae bacterium]|nr:DNA endonuclease SmrA [Cellvibrionaceae bacterium]
MSDSDNDEFHRAMGDVKPIKTAKRIALTPANKADAAAHQLRRQAAETPVVKASDPLLETTVEPLQPQTCLSFCRPGIQHGVYKQLRLGRYTLDARLDLHRMTIEQARKAVYQFIGDCIANDIRCALITHGKGEGRPTPAILKSHLAHWLPQLDTVLAFHSAQPAHGGLGACYLLLKKSGRNQKNQKGQSL